MKKFDIKHINIKNKKLIISVALVLLAIVLCTVAFVIINSLQSKEEIEYKKVVNELVQQNDKNLDMPNVKKIWAFDYKDDNTASEGLAEISESAYNTIAENIENNIGINKYSERHNDAGSFKIKNGKLTKAYSVDSKKTESQKEKLVEFPYDINRVYIILPEGYSVDEYSYDNNNSGELITIVYLVQKHGRYFMGFIRTEDNNISAMYM